jgi:pyruvate formate lyase activating enzyme
MEKLENNTLKCTLCPHNCIINNNRKGFCKVRVNNNGKLVILNKDKLAAIAVDNMEKKPLYHYHPNAKTLSIAANGCNFKCLNCQNYSISQHTDKNTIPFTPKQVVEYALDNKLNHITFTYTEPTVYFEYMLQTAKSAKANNIHCSLVSNGYINKEPLLELIPYIEAANIDLKFASNNYYKEIAKGKVEPVLSTVKTLFENNIITEITTLIIEGIHDTTIEFEKLSKMILEVSNKIPWHLSAFYPTYKMTNYPPTSPDTIIKLREKAVQQGHQYVYTGNIFNPEGETTYCPDCSKSLIKRNRLTLIENRITNGKCPNCNTNIYGMF